LLRRSTGVTMNFQEKVFETTAQLRARAAQRVDMLKSSLASLQVAGRALNTVARRHGSRFVKENSAIALDAAKDVSALARATYSQFAKRDVPVARKRKSTAVRKRPAAKAA
jgi:hypothetical protein